MEMLKLCLAGAGNAMNNEAVEQAIREYLSDVIHMSLATSVDGRPWVCEVHFVYDDKLNIYWRSKLDRRHSKEIAQNPNVAGNIVEQHGMTDKPRGVYFEGHAERLDNVEIGDGVYELFAHRFELGPEILEDAKAETGHQFYKINVSDIYLFDSRESSPSQKYHLNLAEHRS